LDADSQNFIINKDMTYVTATMYDMISPVMLLDEALGFYFTQLFEGKYVDGFGNTLQAPTVSMTITDSEIGGVLSVLVDVIMDYVLRSPVWVDNVNVNSAPKFYPADYASTSSPGSAVSIPTPPAAKPATAAAAPTSQSLVPTAVAFNQELINDYAKNPADFPYSPGTKSDGMTWRWTPLFHRLRRRDTRLMALTRSTSASWKSSSTSQGSSSKSPRGSLVWRSAT
jgi:hypothetical protein